MNVRAAFGLVFAVAACRNHPAPVASEPAPSGATTVVTSTAPATPIESSVRSPGVLPSETSAPAAASAGTGVPPASSVAAHPSEAYAHRDPDPAPRGSTAGATTAPSPTAETTAAKAPIIAARRGAAASGPSYDAWLETTGGYAAGATGSVNAVLTAKAPYKCNVQYPYKLALDPPPPGVTYSNAVVRGMHVDGKHASMPVPFTAASPGSYPVSGTLSFSTCTAEQCLVDKARVSVTIEVR